MRLVSPLAVCATRPVVIQTQNGHGLSTHFSANGYIVLVHPAAAEDQVWLEGADFRQQPIAIKSVSRYTSSMKDRSNWKGASGLMGQWMSWIFAPVALSALQAS